MEDRFNDLEDEQNKNSFSQTPSGSINRGNLGQGQKEVPNAQAIFIIGIVSIALSLCYGIGLVAGIVGLVLAKNGKEDYEKEPELYTKESVKQMTTGKTLSMIGVGVSALIILVLVIIYAALIISSL